MNDNTTTCGPDPVAGQRQPFARWAAKLSLLLPLAAFFLSLVSPHAHLRETKIIVGCLGVLVVLAGLVLALVALRGMRRHGRKGILGFALAGIYEYSGSLIPSMLVHASFNTLTLLQLFLFLLS